MKSKLRNVCFCSFALLFGHIINISLPELGRSICENLYLGCWYCSKRQSLNFLRWLIYLNDTVVDNLLQGKLNLEIVMFGWNF